MGPGDRIWRRFVCRDCDAPVVDLYRRRGQLLADYSTSGRAITAPDGKADTVHLAWFQGINVRQEIEQDEAMNCPPTLDVECHCRRGRINLREIESAANAARKTRVPWTVG